MHGHDDFAFEPSPGIPAPLPEGEHVLWQGKPDWRTLARSPFHVRAVGLWFGALGAFELLRALIGETTLAAALPGIARTLGLGVVAVAILATIAWLTGRVTIYTITDRRLLIRFGIALQVTMNLPFAEVLGADVRRDRDGIGDVPLQVKSTRRVGYAVLWPHVRPWRISRPEPMLRAVPDVDRVAALLVEAMHASLDGRAAASRSPSIGVTGAGASLGGTSVAGASPAGTSVAGASGADGRGSTRGTDRVAPVAGLSAGVS